MAVTPVWPSFYAGADCGQLWQVMPPRVYTVAVTGALNTTGDYVLQLTLNAALERETFVFAPNDTLATAQDLGPSFVGLGGKAARGAVLGVLSFPRPDQDWYRFSADAGDRVSLVLRPLTTTAV